MVFFNQFGLIIRIGPIWPVLHSRQQTQERFDRG